MKKLVETIKVALLFVCIVLLSPLAFLVSGMFGAALFLEDELEELRRRWR